MTNLCDIFWSTFNSLKQCSIELYATSPAVCIEGWNDRKEELNESGEWIKERRRSRREVDTVYVSLS